MSTVPGLIFGALFLCAAVWSPFTDSERDVFDKIGTSFVLGLLGSAMIYWSLFP